MRSKSRWRLLPIAGQRDTFLAAFIRLTLIVFGLLLIWSITSASIDNAERYLPSPLMVAESSLDMIYKGLLPSYFGETLLRLIVGSLIGLALGIPFGLLLAKIL